MPSIEKLGGVSKGRQLSIYVPSKDKDGRSIEHQRWMDRTMEFLTELFGRCTAMPGLEGIWKDKNGNILKETTKIVFSYVEEEALDQHAEEIREFLVEMGKATGQAEVGYGYDGVFYTIAM